MEGPPDTAPTQQPECLPHCTHGHSSDKVQIGRGLWLICGRQPAVVVCSRHPATAGQRPLAWPTWRERVSGLSGLPRFRGAPLPAPPGPLASGSRVVGLPGPAPGSVFVGLLSPALRPVDVGLPGPAPRPVGVGLPGPAPLPRLREDRVKEREGWGRVGWGGGERERERERERDRVRKREREDKRGREV